MIIPFPDTKQEQKDLAARFIKHARASFAGKKQSGYLLITWDNKHDVNVAMFESGKFSMEKMEDYVDAALDVLAGEIED